MLAGAAAVSALAAALGAPPALFAAEPAAGGAAAEVSFEFARQGGIASNQFAVWIEDAEGRYVRTLYATRFTAAGGWRRRPESLPRWAAQSGLAGRDRAHVDALTGPTPGAGALRFAWDGRDYAGRAAPPGEYRVFVEGSLRWQCRVLYSAAIRLGASGRAAAQAEFFGDSIRERGMIGPVTVSF